MSLRSIVAAFGLLAPAAIGCSGILGLHETTERGTDASTGGDDASVDSAVESGQSEGGADATTDGRSVGPDAGDAAMQPDGPVYATNPTSVELVPDASVALKISVMRNGLPGALSIALSGLPTGVTSTTGTIAADAGATSLTVSASPTAPVGSANAALSSNGAQVGTVPVVVNGAPGSVDGSFGGGFVLDTLDPGAIFNAVAVDATGGIVVAGTSNGGSWLVRRYLPTGTLDSTFDTNTDAALVTKGNLAGMIIDPSTGNIICIGQDSGSGGLLTVVILDAQGNVDGSFNSGSPFGLNPNRFTGAAGLAVTLSGTQTLTVVGQEGSGTTSQALVSWALSEQGSPPNSDSQLAFQGAQNTTFAAVGVSQGRVVAGGSTNVLGYPQPIVERFDGGVGPDPSFGDAGGIFTGDVNTTCQVQSLAVMPQSKNVFVAGANTDIERGCFLALTPAGAEVYFKTGTAGYNANFTYWGATPMGDTGDRVYVVGSGGDPWAAELARIAADTGAYDTTFGNGGHATFEDTTYPPNYEYTPKAVAVQPDGRVVVAGQKQVGASANAFVARFWP